MNVLPPIPPKRYSQKTPTSIVLGGISIISTLIALRITISFYDYLHGLGGGWVFIFIFLVIPLMIVSFTFSMIGISLSSGTLGGKRLCRIGLILTFSPILMVFIMGWIGGMQDSREKMQDKQNYSYIDGVKFNKEKAMLIDFSENKKETNYNIPDSVTSIGEYAFYLCTSLTSITIPDGVTSIGASAFQTCSSLTSITIPKSVTSIGDAAFFSCSRLTSITIPDGVTSIGQSTFAGCSSLITVTFLGDAPKVVENAFEETSPTIYRKPEAKGWDDTFGGRPVKLISEKP